MAANVPNITLNDGIIMPLIGLGGFAGSIEIKEDEENGIIDAFKSAIDIGYRLIDTASYYNTEPMLGAAIADKIQDGIVSRQDLFITTKTAGNLSAKDASVELDNEVSPHDTWKAMEECKRLGLTRTIGVSNFNKRQLLQLLDNCTIKPTNNQCEVHLYLQNQKLRHFCRQKGITVVAYSPFCAQHTGDVDISGDNSLVMLAKQYRRNIHQMALRFLHQEGLVVIPKSFTAQRQHENIKINDFHITDDDMAAMRKLDRNQRVIHFKDSLGKSKEYPFHDEY